MKRILIAIVSMVILTISCWPSIAAEDESKDGATKPDTTTSTSDAGKHSKDFSKDPDSDKADAEYKARAEAEGNAKRSAGKRGVGYGTITVDDAASVILPSMHSSGFGGLSKQSGAVVISPGTSNKEPALGVQWISPRRWGVALWASGDLQGDDSIVDGVIPHDDYHMETIKGSYAVEALYSLGSRASMLTGGLGVQITRTENVAVSNVTGWKWEAGTKRTSKLAAQIGWRGRLGGGLSVQYGYDTIQHQFFGLSMDF